MSYFYNITSIPVILNKFKVNNIVISGDLENNLTNIVLKYAENDNISIRFIDLDKFREGLFLDEFVPTNRVEFICKNPKTNPLKYALDMIIKMGNSAPKNKI